MIIQIQVKRRDRLRHRRERQHNLVTAILQASSPKRSKLMEIIRCKTSHESQIGLVTLGWGSSELCMVLKFRKIVVTV